MAERSANSGEIFWSIAWVAAALVAGILVFMLTTFLIADDAAAGLVFGGVAFVVVGALMVAFGPGPAATGYVRADAGHHGHAHAAAHVAPAARVPEAARRAPAPAAAAHAVPVAHVPEAASPAPAPAAEGAAPVGAPVVVASAAPAAPAHSAAAPGPVAEPGGAQGSPATAPISERVRDAARAAGEAARAALGDAAPASAQPPDAGRPAAMPAPEDGGDDLKQIGGIGPKIEQRLHRIGIYHFHQIAGWGPAEVAWVDANLEDYKGRATRDNWVEQAKVLAAGDGKAQSQRRDRGEA